MEQELDRFDHLVERLRNEMRYEFSRTGPPNDFPAFHDVPSKRYTSSEFYELEQKHLWNKVWIVAGRVEDLPDKGSYFLFDDLGLPLLLVRGQDQIIRCFSNTCRHRGAPIVRESTGKVKRLRCQYHAWTYSTEDGQLLAVTDERDFVGLCKEDRALPEIQCEVWGGWIWINLDPDAQPLVKFLGSVTNELEQFKAENLLLKGTDHRIINCNWKAAVDAFLEVYHLKFIHKSGNLPELDNAGAALGLLPNGNSRMVSPFSKSSATTMGMKSWEDFKIFPSEGGLEAIPTVHPVFHGTRYSFTIFPNLVIPLSSTGFPILLFFPIDISHTHLRIFHYGLENENENEEWEKRIAAFGKIIDEDVENLAPIQKSMESSLYQGMPLNYQERRIWYMHETIDKTIGIERIPEDHRIEQLLASYVEPI